jgi:hypothetical protein
LISVGGRGRPSALTLVGLPVEEESSSPDGSDGAPRSSGGDGNVLGSDAPPRGETGGDGIGDGGGSVADATTAA